MTPSKNSDVLLEGVCGDGVEDSSAVARDVTRPVQQAWSVCHAAGSRSRCCEYCLGDRVDTEEGRPSRDSRRLYALHST